MNTEILLFDDKIQSLSIEETKNKIINGDCLQVTKNVSNISV